MHDVKTILCPVDFSDPSRTALEHAEKLAREIDAELVVVHVVIPALYPVAFGAVPTGAPQVTQAATDAAAESLERLMDELKERGTRCRYMVETGTPARRITELVKEQGIDLVVMGTHGMTGIGHVLLGSVAERVVRLCPCPVLSVKPGQVAV